MIGAKRHELPINGNSFGPGISAYGLMSGFRDVDPLALSSVANADGSIVVATSFGNILMADENVVRLTSALAAALVPILTNLFLNSH